MAAFAKCWQLDLSRDCGSTLSRDCRPPERAPSCPRSKWAAGPPVWTVNVGPTQGIERPAKVRFAALLKICAAMTDLCAPTDKWTLRMSSASKKFPPFKNLGHGWQTGTPLD
jgi:hypothetical protein